MATIAAATRPVASRAVTPAAFGPMDIPEVKSRWVDGRGREVLDIAEVAIAGVSVGLLDPQGREVARTRTDAAGSYQFDDIRPGNYVVVFTVPEAIDQPDTALTANRWPHDRTVLTDVQTWTSGPRGFRLVGTLI